MELLSIDLGDLLLAIALLFGSLIVLSETSERRRELRREQQLLDSIDAEYHAYSRLGLL